MNSKRGKSSGPRELEDKSAIEAGGIDSNSLGIQSIEIGMKLLATLVEHSFENPPPMLKTLASDAGIQPAKAHRYMVSLVRSKLVERDPVSRRYQLGPMARMIGVRAIQSLDVVRTTSARLPNIVADLGHSVALSIWADGPTIIAVEVAKRQITIGTRIGEVMPLLSSATGKVFGAWLPRSLTQDRIRREISSPNSFAGRVPTGKAEIDKLFEGVREVGLGVTEGGMNPTVNALSAPIFDHRGTLVAALSALGPASEFDASLDGAIARQLRAIASEISEELGYTPLVAKCSAE